MKRLTKKQIDKILDLCSLAEAAADEIAEGTPDERRLVRNVRAGVSLVVKILKENQAPARKHTGKQLAAGRSGGATHGRIER